MGAGRWVSPALDPSCEEEKQAIAHRRHAREDSVKRLPVVCILVALLAFPWTQAALAQTDFYKGKTVTLVIGSRVTGSLSIGAQIVARHIGKHIPGNPTGVLRQMPGGAHLNATNYVYNVAEPDGLTILAVNPAVATAQLLKVSAVRFDVRKFEWLGSSGAEGAIFAIRPDLPYKTFQELRDSGRELIAGTTGPGSNAHDVPLLLKEFAGVKIKLVTGYAANADIRLALERKEVDAWTSMATTIRLAAERGIVRPLVRSSRAPVPTLNHLPVDEDLAASDLGRRLMLVRGTPLAIGRAYGVRPGTPPERVAILRQAIAKVLADPQFLAEAKAAQIEMELIAPEEVAKRFDAMINQPLEVVEAMHKYIKAGE
jgi:tripartite-type tricarboxylate transporter receptor subunit TctC